MSEYQYYDFRAIDRSLTPSQIDETKRLSSRASITNRRAEFIYNYGSFRGDVEQLVLDMFDMVLCVTGLGTRRLIFRLPANLFDVSQCHDFCISEEIDHRRSGSKIILDLNFNDEESDGEWVEDGDWLDDLLPLRDELLRGDLRVLYLAWFKAAEKALCNDEIREDSPEPLVPAGLNELSAAQLRFAELMGINRIDIQALAENSPPLSQQVGFKPEEWLGMLSEQEKNDYLLRLSHGEDKLDLHLNRRLKMLWQRNTESNDNNQNDDNQPTSPQSERRGIQELLDACQTRQFAIEKEAERRAEIAVQNKLQKAAGKRSVFLDQLSGRENELWVEVEQLIEKGQARYYEQAASHLYDLNELAEKKGEQAQFLPKFQALTEKYQRRRILIERLRENGLL